ncbi:MAG: hypothetical protein WAO55_16505 [Candidatus Manganitrophaceae bacterium]
MKQFRINTRSILILILAVIGIWGTIAPAKGENTAPGGAAAEIEKYVKARIDLGESMRGFFQKRGGAMQFGDPEKGGPSVEELKKLEEEINAEVAKVLAKHDLTIEEYQKKSPEVFADKEAVERFLSEHPDLKQQYESLPPSPMRGRR